MGHEHSNGQTIIECYYYVRGYCNHREESSIYCSGKGCTCERYKQNMSTEQWKEKYWNLMRALREKVGR